MNKDKLNIIYTAEDIDQYFSGRLLPAQMHAMEKAALDDPFLAEAMEGYAEMKKESWEKELQKARRNIENKQTEKKITPIINIFKWWKAVAAVLVIAGGTGLVYLLNNSASNKSKTANIASLKKDSIDTVNSIAGIIDLQKPSIAADTNKNSDGKLIAQVKNNTLYDSTIAYEPPKRNRVEVLQNENANSIAEDQRTNSEKNLAVVTAPAAPNNIVTQTNRENEFNKSAKQNDGITAPKKEAVMNRIFVAEVIGEDKASLPFAKINIPAENVGTYADVNGKFRLVGVDSTLNIEVRAAGFATQTINIKSGAAKNTIILNEAPFATKDIVQLKSKAGKSNAENRKGIQFDTVLNVEPVDGWDNYNTYLDNNITPPTDVLQKNIHGEVEVSFDVQSNGKLSNVNIAKSLCGNCDEEALRVIKEGPQWKVKKGKKEKGKVKIKF